MTQTDSVDYLLYSTEACHLCDLAKQLLNPIATAHGFSVRYVDISEDDSLIEDYGTRIPVLHKTRNGAELNWPFDLDAVKTFIRS